MLFCSCVVCKLTANIDKKALNMHHQAQKGFNGIFVEIPQHKKGYLAYIPSTRKIISSYNDVFNESSSNKLSYTPQPYVEAMAMRPDVSYTTYAASSREQIGNIITFAQFEEVNSLSEASDNSEISDKSDDNSTMSPLIREE